MTGVIGRLVGIVATYREGPLAASAIRSILPHVDNVVVFEGPVGDGTDAPDAYETDLTAFRKNSRVIIQYGKWQTDADKRNAMLAYTRRMPTPTWAVYLDADEVFIGAEYIRDLIWAAHVNAPDGQRVTAIPVHTTEVDSSVGRIHRLIRMDALERHVLSMSQLKFFDQETLAVFPVIPVWRPGEPVTEFARPPMQGEPHIHHRSYYRPTDRGRLRLHVQEVDDFNAALLEPQGFPRQEVQAVEPAAADLPPQQPIADPFGILRRE
jgi:hypothetical protein